MQGKADGGRRQNAANDGIFPVGNVVNLRRPLRANALGHAHP
jgi:hypothetical protein